MTSNDATPPRGNGSRESEIEEILADCLDRLNEVGFVEPEEILAWHPDLGPAILEELQAYIGLSQENDQPPSPLGTLGDYTLRRQIGRGGMGVVYEAWESSMERAVALKVLPAGIAADDRALQRFVREARTAGKLNHPNIVSVYGMGLKEETPYYAMEYVEGETLARILARTRDAEPETGTPFGKKDDTRYFANLAEAFADVAEGLQHAHSRGVTHRDIKPSNLIFSRRAAGDLANGADRETSARSLSESPARLRILDFGLARLEGQESLTVSGDVLGTPLYMSPEQARRRKVPIDHRTDIYSLGATMYEAVTGRPPFRGRDHADTLSQIIERDPVEPRRLNSRIPGDLQTIVLKCLRKDCADRYGSAEALAQDLRRFVRGDPIEASPPSRWEQLGRRLRRRRRGLVAALLVVALLSVSALFLHNVWSARRLARREAYESAVLSEKRNLLRSRTLLRPAAGIVPELGPEGASFTSPVKLAESGVARIAESVGALERIARELPGRFEAHYYRAVGLATLGRMAEAREALGRVRTIAADFVPARVLESELQEPTGARSQLRALIGEYDDSAWQRWWVAAHLAMREREWARAASAQERLLQMNRSHRALEGRDLYLGSGLDFRLGRGLALLEAGDEGSLRAAEAEFILARDREPSLIEPALLLAKTYYLNGSGASAQAVLAELHGESSGDRRDLTATWSAILYFWLGDVDAGLRWLDRVEDEGRRERLRAAVHLGVALGEASPVPWRDASPPVLYGSMSADRLTLYIDQMDGPPYDTFDLYRARRESVDEPFGPRERLPEPASSDAMEFCPVLSPDGRWLYFGSRREGGHGNFDLYAAGPLPPGDPGPVIDRVFNLGEPINSEKAESIVGPHEDEFYFITSRVARRDLWVARFREPGNPEGGFSDARPLTALNTPEMVIAGGISPDGTMLFFADQHGTGGVISAPRAGGFGGGDLWVAMRHPLAGGGFGPWQTPLNVRQLNTPGHDVCPSPTPDGKTLLFTRTNPDSGAYELQEAPILGWTACQIPPLEARRSIRPEAELTAPTVKLEHGDEHGSWLPGEPYRVTIELSSVRPAGFGCAPPRDIVIEETVPVGWTARSPSVCGEVMDGTVTWRLERGRCGADPYPEALVYEVIAGDIAAAATFRGEIREAGFAPFPVEGDSELFSTEPFTRDGFIRTWLLLGPFRGPENECKTDPALPVLRADYLTDGVTGERYVVPRDGERVETAFGAGAASTGLAHAAGRVEINSEGIPAWQRWIGLHDTLSFDRYYGRNLDHVVMYAAVYLKLAERRQVSLGIAHDDAAQVFLDGKEIWVKNVDDGARPGSAVRDHIPVRWFDAGPHLLLVKVLENCGHHELRLRLENPESGEPLTEADGITLHLDPVACGYSPPGGGGEAPTRR